MTLLVTSSINMDPVNVSKLLLTSGIGFAMILLILSNARKRLFFETSSFSILVCIFIFWAVLITIFGDGPFNLNFYGLNGRNTGLLAYLSLSFIALGASVIREVKIFERIVWGLIFAGIVNVCYCLLALSGHDVINWNNVYNTILGTFGNPDFISAFLGIFIASAISFSLNSNLNIFIRLSLVVFAVMALYEIKRSHAIQGLAVTALAIGAIGFFYLRSISKSRYPVIFYTLSMFILGGLAIGGALQIGPLTKYIYKTSISLRGEYWQAGINMGLNHPIFGLGFDGYGDWYRRARSAHAMILPGPGTVTNSAHNVVVDIFASGGFPLLLIYLSLFVLTLISIVKIALRSRTYDSVFVAMSVSWLCYVAQSVISINQIGLAIWGWVLMGAIIGYERSTQESPNSIIQNTEPKSRKIKTIREEVSPSAFLFGFSGLAIGLIIALPPFLADANWRSAVGSGKVDLVVAASTKFPMDSLRMTQTAATLEDNKFPDLAHEVILKAISYNPSYFDSWKMLNYLSKSSTEEKQNALKRMSELDPRNQEWKKVAP